MFENIQPTDLKQRLDAGESLRILDVREQQEWEIGHLDGAELRPLSRFQEWMKDLEPDGGPYVLYCHHGMRSQQACTALAQQGVQKLINLSGGIDNWSRTVDPSVPTY